MKKILLILFCLAILIPLPLESAAQEQTVLYFFWGEECPHCHSAKIFLEKMQEKYDSLEVRMFETWHDSDNHSLLQKMVEAYEIQAQGVPISFLGNYDPIVGFVEYMAADFEKKISQCIENGCIDPGVKAGITAAKPLELNPALITEHPLLEEEDTISAEQDKEICLHLFCKGNCPHCDNIDSFILDLEKKQNIVIKKYNIDFEEDNSLYQSFKALYGLQTAAYPIVFLGNSYYIGEKSIQDHLEKEILNCREKECICPLGKIRGTTPLVPQATDMTPEKQDIINVPFFGEIDFSEMSLVATTVIIAFVDGFNPCSLWLITFLLGIVIYSGSKKKTLIVGLTFLIVTGTAYALFMLGLLNVFSYIGYLRWIQILVALVALSFALINIKDYFWYKKGISLTISDKHKPRIFQSIRKIMQGERRIWPMILGTITMALGVTLVELPCTAGFPVIWTNMIATNHLTDMNFSVLLGLYMLIYLLDEIIVVAAVSFSLKKVRFEEKHGRILKLISGMIMLSLGLIMIVKPNLMNNLGGFLFIFIATIVLSLIFILIHRKILPLLGIKFGNQNSSEKMPSKPEDSSQ